MPKRKREKWPTSVAVTYCGFADAHTLHQYRVRNGFPEPIPGEFGPRGERYFWADEVQRWQASRRGPGRRRDTPKETP